jgi:alkylhydroperoxidase family enzyme
VGSEAGVSDEKLNALAEYRNNQLFSRRERLALEYAEGMTVTGREVSDELFAALKSEFSDEELIVLTEVIAWENASSKFNRALRIPSQRLWQPRLRP